MTDASNFAQWFQSQLRRREWTQADAARRLNVSTGVISYWFNGNRVPSPQSCDLISDAFGVPVDLVLELAGHRPSSLPVDPESPVSLLQNLVERVEWSPERQAVVEGILRGFIDRDRKGGAA